ncbi:hypothetical protein DFJ73DRAFT_821347 [Zopfochytrium polystomum]|nr:hypothetical protein DFJ73DRAFT_821347 [Zopfochytrium polystomum]
MDLQSRVPPPAPVFSVVRHLAHEEFSRAAAVNPFLAAIADALPFLPVIPSVQPSLVLATAAGTSDGSERQPLVVGAVAHSGSAPATSTPVQSHTASTITPQLSIPSTSIFRFSSFSPDFSNSGLFGGTNHNQITQVAVLVMSRLIADRWRVPPPTSPAATAAISTIERHIARLRRFASIALATSNTSTTHLGLAALLFVHRLVGTPVGAGRLHNSENSSAAFATQTPLPLPPSLNSPSRLLLAGLLLAEAIWADSQTSCELWARAAGIAEGARGVCKIKMDAVKALHWKVAISSQEYVDWMRAVKDIVASAALRQAARRPLVSPLLA